MTNDGAAMFQPDSHIERNRFSAGHWTNREARTGCTVVVFDRAAPAIVDVRGGAPGTRETDLLGPGMLVQSVDAIVLSGGSAFGLAAADGVMQELRAAGRGVATPAGPVPIVPAAVIFDLAAGQAVWPTAADGATAYRNRTAVYDMPRGLVGVGAGATSGKLFSTEKPERGGLGYGFCELTPGRGIHALVAVNPSGTVVDPESGRRVLNPSSNVNRAVLLERMAALHDRAATTLAIVIVDAPSDRRSLERCAAAAHDGLARAIWPCHTLFDGDIAFVASLEAGTPNGMATVQLGLATELAIERAILDAVTAD